MTAGSHDDANASDERAPGRIDVEFERHRDAHAVDPRRGRDTTDAGVAVGVDEETRIRTGVRVEQETGREREDPTPTVGIERRF